MRQLWKLVFVPNAETELEKLSFRVRLLLNFQQDVLAGVINEQLMMSRDVGQYGFSVGIPFQLNDTQY